MKKNALDVMTKRYDEFASDYIETWSQLEGYSNLVNGFIADAVKGPCRVLDVGCGPGHFVAKLPESVEVVGLDLSEKMLEQAKLARPSGKFVSHNYYDPVPKNLGIFDVVIAVGSLDFCEDLPLVLGHLRKAMNPKGRALINLILRRPGVRGHEDHRLAITPERMPGVDLIFYRFEEMSEAIFKSGFFPKTYRHYQGYRNQYHELDIEYAMWELEAVSDG